MPTKKQVIAGVVAGVAVGGVIYALSKRSKKAANDDVEFTAVGGALNSGTATSAPAADPTLATQPSSELSGQFTREYSFRANADNERMLDEALAEQDTHKAPRAAVQNKLDGSVSFEHLGVALVPPAGWTVREEMSPMPNVAMISLSKPEFAERQMNPEDMGSVPVVILSVEDISNENLDLLEFKEKSKQMALTQMMMMTNGMIQPHIKLDEKLQVGQFHHCLEYGQSLPPYFELSVCNLLAVQNGLAFVFQIMCSPKVMTSYKPIFMEIARTIKIAPGSDANVGRVELVSHGVKATIPPSWQWAAPSADSSALIEFTTPSTTKSEQILLYRASSAPSSAGKHTKNEKTVNGVTITALLEGRNETKEFKYGDFVAVVKPLQKSNVQIHEGHVCGMLKSVSLASSGGAESANFVNSDHGYSFAVVKGSKLIASRVGGGAVVYAPLGVPADPQRAAEEEQGPTVTIRVGTPDTDPDCAESLDAWEERMEAEKANGNILSIQRIKKSGEACLAFQSKDMQEIGPGQRMEVMGKVFIFVRDGKTTLVRWETATGLWRKYETKMEQLLDSFKFL